MDNLTHALAGMLLAEAAVQLRSSAPAPASSKAPSLSWRSAAYVVSVAGNNLPDLDVVWSGVTERPFGYLLHHRGHSHTLLGAFVATVFVVGAVSAFVRVRRLAWSRADHRWIVALGVVGPLAHIAMDTCNNYGTHPFWPLYRGWIYGDAVFIAEPFFWAAGIPPLVFAARSAITRITLLLVLSLGVGVTFFLRFVPTPLSVALALVAVGAALAASRTAPRTRPLLGIGACLVVATSFFCASSVAATAIGAALHNDSDIDDIVVTPMPANPFCFTALTVEMRDEYLVRRATVATWPELFPARLCPDTEERPTAPFGPSTAADTSHVHWRGEYTAPLAELTNLYRENCQAAALLRFFRVPYWVGAGDEMLIMGDLRYDRNPGLDFSDVRIERRPRFCPTAVPSWLPPRHHLLERVGVSSPARYEWRR